MCYVIMDRKQGGRSFYSANKSGGVQSKKFTLIGGRSLKESRAILLCEDTSSALYYFKFFKRSYRLNVDVEPKAKQTQKSKSADGLNKIFVRANFFYNENPDRKVFLAYDLDEFYRQNEPKIANKDVYEAFLKANAGNKNFIYLDSFPCFEFWLLLHFSKTMKYYDSYDELFKDLTKKCQENKLPAEAKSSSHYYCKSQKYWENLCKDLFKYFPEEKLKDAITYSRTYELEIGKNSHSNIWKFFKEYASEIDFLSEVFK
jgi:hypothetical protein